MMIKNQLQQFFVVNEILILKKIAFKNFIEAFYFVKFSKTIFIFFFGIKIFSQKNIQYKNMI